MKVKFYYTTKNKIKKSLIHLFQKLYDTINDFLLMDSISMVSYWWYVDSNKKK